MDKYFISDLLKIGVLVFFRIEIVYCNFIDLNEFLGKISLSVLELLSVLSL